jgi:trimeric autotransporter adhesin
MMLSPLFRTTRQWTAKARAWIVTALAAASMVAFGQLPMRAAGRRQDLPPSSPGQSAAKPAQPAGCRVTGTVKAGATPLPGAAVVVTVGDTIKAATSSGLDGKFTILFGPNATYHVAVSLMSFTKVERDLTLGAVPCDTTLEFDLSLKPRGELAPAAAPAEAVAETPTSGAKITESQAQAVPAQAAAAARGRGAGPAGGRQGASQPTGQSFQALNVQTDASGQAAIDATPPDTSGDLSRFLPSGFTAQTAGADAVAIQGSGDAVNIDRGALNDRLQAIGRGEFDPSTGQFAAGFGPGAGGPGGPGGFGDQGGGGGGGFGGRGGGFFLGGRGGRGQSLYQGSVTYNYGGSPLNATSLQPRNTVDADGNPVVAPAAVSSLPYARNNFGGTFGGPLKIPGLYADTNRRTNFQVNYSGAHSTQLQDQYATVPTLAERNGDFSSSALQLINPATGLPFANNQIPSSDMNSSALALLQYIPAPNVAGAGATQNYHTAATTLSTSNSVSLRVTQNLSPTVPQPGAGGRGGGRGGGFGGGRGGGRGGRGLSIMLNAQLQYRENTGQSFNVLPLLGGTSKSTSIAAPISLNISKGRTTNTFSFQINRSQSSSSNFFSNVTDVAGNAGINYPAGAATDPLNWGVPNLSFSNFNVRSSAANLRTDQRLTLGYAYSHPFGRHRVRIGADFRRDLSTSETNSNARGTFTFTGLYTSGGAQASGNSGADFADFLLGLPQQASLQVGGTTKLREKAFDVYVEDNWQQSARMTLSLGARYEVTLPYVEVNGQMANLDVAPNFTGAAVVTPGQTGPYTGAFPAGLVNPDWNNVGPRLGVAYRLARNTILRGGYSITYNSGSYASIARQLVGQPPYAQAETNVGTLADPLTLENGLVDVTSTTTNNYGVDKNYGLGMIQTWNATFSRQFWRNWILIAGYTGTKGTSLDLLRAPNRNPDGTLRIDGVQAFIWESSGGHSILQLGNFQLRRLFANGFSAGVNYTLAKSMDNASSLGAGGAVVAQNDQDLAAEWALSNFDQRHQFSADVDWELPFGVGRRWLSDGGFWAALVGEWSMSLNFSAHSGSPFTPRIVGATSSVANGTSGSLRADYSGSPISLSDPTLAEYFNTGVFSIPLVGDFGTSPRNVIIGPGGHVVNATFSRDMRIGQYRAVSIQVSANNLFNTIQWTAIDTNVNSRTFGQVTRFAGMRTITANLRFRF